ncbi:MAG TPA: PQQ-binding-like beta-propeller repeat protein [Polyangia bacterium]|nr:PQQ-binding-like beta-propeller repeat protein [Polyangia bacterium]
MLKTTHPRLFVVIALAGGALSAPRAAHADDWATLGLDGARTRLATERSGTSFSDGHWTYAPKGGARVLSSPVVADGYAVSVDLDGNVSALHADSGALAWRVAAGSGVQGTPAIARGRIYVPTLGNKLVALALADGSPLWTARVGGMAVSSPAVIGSDVILSAGFPQRHVVRIDGVTGAVIWQSPPVMGELSNSSPAVAGGLVVVGSNGGHFYAFDAATGAPRWDYQADGVVALSSALIAGGRVYIAGGDDSDHVHAVDALTGAAVPGWPIDLAVPDIDVDGKRLDRHRAVSSPVFVGGSVVLVTRLDDTVDTDADGAPDHYLSRELAVALDPATGQVVWQHALARAVVTDPNLVPKFFVCPTPAAFAADGGAALLAVASSLAARVAILDPASGRDLNDVAVAGPALASPVMANGRLITVAFSDVVEGQVSAANHPPAAPVLAGNPNTLDAADVTLRWLPATDPDAEMPTYEVRIDSDGEILQSYTQQLFPGQGATSVALTPPLAEGVVYTVAVRARDGHGAYSPWSAAETFTVATPPPVTVNGNPVASLRAAVENAMAGDMVLLGAGTYPLSSTLHVAGGVTVTGAGAGRTILDGRGVAVGISFTATDPKAPTGLDKATVSGAATCISVGGNATGIELSHLVTHDCATAGIAVAAGGTAAVINATLVGNGIGLDATGSAAIKNSLVSGNRVGLAVESSGSLTSSYDDLFGNQTDRQGLAAGTGELSAPVTFANPTAHDYRLAGPQASTDQGDPADAVGDEPTPNGSRINLGAFGGTAEAERSTPAAVTPDPTGSPVPTSTPGIPGTVGHPGDEGGGCAVAGRAPRGSSPWSLLLAVGALGALIRTRRRR